MLRLLSLEVAEFRNLARVSLRPAPGATVLVGRNGQGKTNLLEALYFLCTLRPLRASRLAELVRFGQGEARVVGRFQLGGAEREISVELTAGQRVARVDGKRASSLEAYLGGVSVVAFTPDDLEAVKGSPERRRALLDRAVFNRFPAYLAESRVYARALKSRNRLLKDRAPADYVRAYDEALGNAGARVWKRRLSLLGELAPRASAAFGTIGRGAGPTAGFRYAPAVVALAEGEEEAQWSSALLEALTARLGRDLERGYTSVGPHADDVLLELDGASARAFASQGQQRALVLAWKIAEIENLSDHLGFLPLLLLDDVSSELDPEKNAYLMTYLAHTGAQVFLTTTDRRLVEGAARDSTLWCEVEAGAVRPA